MACTYDYDTGKIALDFHLVKYDEICELRGIKGRVGVDECHRCPFHGGTYTDHQWTMFVRCKHPEAKDSEGSFDAMYDICEKFREEALTHFYD